MSVFSRKIDENGSSRRRKKKVTQTYCVEESHSICLAADGKFFDLPHDTHSVKSIKQSFAHRSRSSSTLPQDFQPGW